MLQNSLIIIFQTCQKLGNTGLFLILFMDYMTVSNDFYLCNINIENMFKVWKIIGHKIS